MTHIHEVALYATVCFLPCFALEFYTFRKSLRYPPPVTAVLTILLIISQLYLCLCSSEATNARRIMMEGTILNILFFVIAVKDLTGRVLFMVLMIANDFNLALATSDYLRFLLLPQLWADTYHWTHSLIIVCTEAILLLPISLYVRQAAIRTTDDRRKILAWNYLWLIPATFYGIWCVLFVFSDTAVYAPQASLEYFLVTLMLFICGLVVYLIVNQLSNEHVQIEELREREYHFNIQRSQYASLQERIEEARRARHDLRHHMHLVQAYLNDGHYDALRTYVNRYSDAFPEDSPIAYCDHYAANALLMYFSGQAERSGIAYNVHVDLPIKVGIPDEALVVVLGNLLENAIGACQEEAVPSSIRVYGRTDESAVFFKISNTCTRPPRKNAAGRYVTTKRGGTGIGLSSVESIAQQYRGILETNFQDNTFHVSIMLTLPE